MKIELILVVVSSLRSLIWDGCKVYTADNKNCTQCKPGYFLKDEGLIQYCYICDRESWSINCEECIDDFNCTKCKSGVLLKEGICYPKCQVNSDCAIFQNKFYFNSICLQNYCQVCTSNEDCLAAFPGYTYSCFNIKNKAFGNMCGECQDSLDCRYQEVKKICSRFKTFTDKILTPRCVQCEYQMDCLEPDAPFCNQSTFTCQSDCTAIVDICNQKAVDQNCSCTFIYYQMNSMNSYVENRTTGTCVLNSS